MIERLLAAERAVDAGQLEVAERLFAQVEAADPRNAIAMTGRAKVAHAQGELEAARRHVARALETDPDDAAAQALSAALQEPAEPPVAGDGAEPAEAAERAMPSAPSSEAPAAPVVRPAATTARGSAVAERVLPPDAAPPPPAHRSILRSIGRFLRGLVGR